MSRLPQINIVSNDDASFTTAHVGKKLIVVRWRDDEQWWVARPGHAPYAFGAELDAVRAFMGITVEATG